MPGQRKIFDALNRCPSFVPELVAEVDSLQVVVANRLVELTAGRQKKAEPSSLSSEFNKYLFSIDCRKLSSVVRCNAIFSFLEP